MFLLYVSVQSPPLCTQGWQLLRNRGVANQIKFRIDTGARCETIALSDYQKIQHEGELKRSRKLLRTYSNHQIKPVAVAELSLEHNSNLATTAFQIVDFNQENLLSGNTAEALQLISTLASIDTPPPPREIKFPKDFTSSQTLLKQPVHCLEPTQSNWNLMPKVWSMLPAASR